MKEAKLIVDLFDAMDLKQVSEANQVRIATV